MAEHEAVERGRHCPNKLHRCSRPSHLSKLSLRTGITSLESSSFFFFFFTTSDSQHANNASIQQGPRRTQRRQSLLMSSLLPILPEQRSIHRTRIVPPVQPCIYQSSFLLPQALPQDQTRREPARLRWTAARSNGGLPACLSVDIDRNNICRIWAARMRIVRCCWPCAVQLVFNAAGVSHNPAFGSQPVRSPGQGTCLFALNEALLQALVHFAAPVVSCRRRVIDAGKVTCDDSTSLFPPPSWSRASGLYATLPKYTSGLWRTAEKW